MVVSSKSDFSRWFARFAADLTAPPMVPREWQEDLARNETPRSRLIQIPTGYGKTLGVLGTWLYHRVERNDDRWPRRLVWVLPMRVLVEQTAREVQASLARLDWLWIPDTDHRGKVGAHLLMGGADQDGEWNLYPEENAVLVATQDMALSRALNRGYAAPRARWPMELGLLSQDVLWVLDEVQLMDVGLATSAQLQAFFDDEGSRAVRPRLSWWMSATLQPAWLRSVDTAAHHPAWIESPTTLSATALASGLATIRKAVVTRTIADADHNAFATAIKEAHQKGKDDGEYGRITLVVCNTVERACRTFDALQALDAANDLRLVHSRFRARERAAWQSDFLRKEACCKGANRIIVATQVVEAGVDITATALVTELAPWSSLVQRFGRCARYGGSGTVLVIDRNLDEKTARPYALEELAAAKRAVDRLAAGAGDVGIANLAAFESTLSPSEREHLYPYRPKQLILRREFDELFDTTPDLTGADVDVSPFIRSGDERDLLVFWVEIPPARKGEPAPSPPREGEPSREDLCPVPFLAARDWLCGKQARDSAAARLLPSRRAWVWDWIDGEWKTAQRSALLPGVVVCVAADTGGYREDRGFDSESKAPVPLVGVLGQTTAQDESDDREDTEALSAAAVYQTIATHTAHVAAVAAQIADGLVPQRVVELLALAGHWHDVGKAHPSFQAIISARGPYLARLDLAKAPEGAWQRPCLYRSADGDTRRGFRHELASCLALFSVLRRYEPSHAALLGPWIDVLALTDDVVAPVPVTDTSDARPLERQVLACTADEFDLLAYLVLAHHGKVRVALHAGPKDQEYIPRDGRGLPIRGVRENDVLAAVPLDVGSTLPALPLTLAPAALGLSPITGRSWRDRTGALLRAYGPGTLAYLEALLIAADRRASKLTVPDPLLAIGAAKSTS